MQFCYYMYVYMSIFIFFPYPCLHTCRDGSFYAHYSEVLVLPPQTYWKLSKEGTMAYTAAEFPVASNTALCSE